VDVSVWAVGRPPATLDANPAVSALTDLVQRSACPVDKILVNGYISTKLVVALFQSMPGARALHISSHDKISRQSVEPVLRKLRTCRDLLPNLTAITFDAMSDLRPVIAFVNARVDHANLGPDGSPTKNITMIKSVRFWYTGSLEGEEAKWIEKLRRWAARGILELHPYWLEERPNL